MNVWVIGAGGMSIAYFKVLEALGNDIRVIGRGEKSAAAFEAQCGASVERGGLGAYLRRSDVPLPDAAIVSVGVEVLASTTRQLIEHGVRRILVEKPGGMNEAELRNLHRAANAAQAEVFIAYNRRFYTSVRQARSMIAADGGVQSFNFEFTEWGHEIEGLAKAPGVKEHWVLANSSHVIDLAFHLGGEPDVLQCFHEGRLSWHPAAAVFAGAGRTRDGALFSYQANWGAPGRWGVEVCCRNFRLVFRPMEMLHVVRKGSVAVEPISAEDDAIDKTFKPGLFHQVDAFLHGKSAEFLCSLDSHMRLVPFYTKIAGY